MMKNKKLIIKRRASSDRTLIFDFRFAFPESTDEQELKEILDEVMAVGGSLGTCEPLSEKGFIESPFDGLDNTDLANAVWEPVKII